MHSDVRFVTVHFNFYILIKLFYIEIEFSLFLSCNESWRLVEIAHYPLHTSLGFNSLFLKLYICSFLHIFGTSTNIPTHTCVPCMHFMCSHIGLLLSTVLHKIQKLWNYKFDTWLVRKLLLGSVYISLDTYIRKYI